MKSDNHSGPRIVGINNLHFPKNGTPKTIKVYLVNSELYSSLLQRHYRVPVNKIDWSSKVSRDIHFFVTIKFCLTFRPNPSFHSYHHTLQFHPYTNLLFDGKEMAHNLTKAINSPTEKGSSYASPRDYRPCFREQLDCHQTNPPFLTVGNYSAKVWIS